MATIPTQPVSTAATATPVATNVTHVTSSSVQSPRRSPRISAKIVNVETKEKGPERTRMQGLKQPDPTLYARKVPRTTAVRKGLWVG